MTDSEVKKKVEPSLEAIVAVERVGERREGGQRTPIGGGALQAHCSHRVRARRRLVAAVRQASDDPRGVRLARSRRFRWLGGLVEPSRESIGRRGGRTLRGARGSRGRGGDPL